MLVLTRRLQEKIQIGSNVTVTILRLKGNVVQVGIDAPKDVRILRAELHDFSAQGHAATTPSSTEHVTQTSVELVGEPADAQGESAKPEEEGTASEGVNEGPSVGRRFVIHEQRGRFGRRQVLAVAAP